MGIIRGFRILLGERMPIEVGKAEELEEVFGEGVEVVEVFAE